MCGISGVIVTASDSFRVTKKLVTEMRDTMIHRGPDDCGDWVSEDCLVGLGHRRLSIIDLADAAGQPMANENGSVRIVFNGEIYNHSEIRRELEEIGAYQWKTDHSDTEVIIHAYEHWGIDCLQRLRGMFAIAIWDDNIKKLWLIRDRLGEKPLYYSIHNGRVTFASEIKALLKDPQQKREVNEVGLFHYLSFLTTPAPDTLFAGINKLPCASWLCIGLDGTVEEQRYWDVLDHTESLQGATEDEVASRLLDEIKNSVRMRKIGDVPVGVFLSGGVDSSTNAALFAEGESQKVKTFSIGYEGNYSSYQNELIFAKLVADQVKSEHHETFLSFEDLNGFLRKMVQLQDEPIADPVCFPVFFVSKLARDNGVVVCQVGEGADELFCGYPGWITSLRLQKYSNLPLPLVFKKLGMSLLRLFGKDQSFSYEWLRRGSENLPIFWGGAEGFTETHKLRLLSSRLRKQLNGLSSWNVIEPIRSRFLKKAKVPSWLNWMTYLDLNFRLPELLLMRVDKMSMGVSLEGRVPFLDHKLVEFSLSIPAEMKTRGGLKYILKKAVRGTIPDVIIDRPKQGFGVPIHEWFLDNLGPQIRSELEEFCNKTDFFDRDEVFRVLDEGRAAQAWYLYNLALWWKEYIDVNQSV